MLSTGGSFNSNKVEVCSHFKLQTFRDFRSYDWKFLQSFSNGVCENAMTLKHSKAVIMLWCYVDVWFWKKLLQIYCTSSFHKSSCPPAYGPVYGYSQICMFSLLPACLMCCSCLFKTYANFCKFFVCLFTLHNYATAHYFAECIQITPTNCKRHNRVFT